MCCDTKKAIGITTIAIAALAVAAAGILMFKEKTDRKKVGGRLVRVNYKFSKEFDD